MTEPSSKQLTQNLYKEILSTEHRVLGREFFGDFLNWGYWKADTENQIEACANLAELVFNQIPQLQGRVLEIGCGIGGITKQLSKRIPAEDITAINILDDQLEQCRSLVPGATFVAMDAAALTFPDASFDSIVSVEAAHHFSSREAFFRGALRVLKPGGYLSLCDIIGYPFGGRTAHIADPRAYQECLADLGFCEVRVADITADSAHAHADYVMGWLQEQFDRGMIDQSKLELGGIGRVVRMALSPFYVAACARKPIAGKPSWRSEPGQHINAYMRTLLVKTADV
jgi:MPBQ/MSBQ methyltransferase